MEAPLKIQHKQVILLAKPTDDEHLALTVDYHGYTAIINLDNNDIDLLTYYLLKFRKVNMSQEEKDFLRELQWEQKDES